MYQNLPCLIIMLMFFIFSYIMSVIFLFKRMLKESFLFLTYAIAVWLIIKDV